MSAERQTLRKQDAHGSRNDWLASALLHVSRLFGAGELTRQLIHALLERYAFLDTWHESLSVWARILCLRPIVPVLRRYLPADGTVLDLGCGYGLSLHLARMLCDMTVYGIELDQARYEIARRSVVGQQQMHVVQGGLLTSDWPCASAILLLDVLFMIPSDIRRQILARCASHLEPNGILIIKDTAPTPRWKFRYTAFEERCKLRWNAYGTGHEHHLHYFGSGELHALATSLGFEHVETKPIQSVAPYPGIFYIYRYPAPESSQLL